MRNIRLWRITCLITVLGLPSWSEATVVAIDEPYVMFERAALVAFVRLISVEKHAGTGPVHAVGEVTGALKGAEKGSQIRFTVAAPRDLLNGHSDYLLFAYTYGGHKKSEKTVQRSELSTRSEIQSIFPTFCDDGFDNSNCRFLAGRVSFFTPHSAYQTNDLYEAFILEGGRFYAILNWSKAREFLRMDEN